MLPDQTKALTLVGFAAVIALMLALTWVGVSRIDASVKRTEDIVHQNKQKTELVTRMRTAAGERTLSLQKMLLQPDLFARNDEWTRFNAAAAEFGAARRRLLRLRLSPQERTLLRHQAQLARENIPVQEQVAQLALAGQSEQASALLMQRALPGQERVFQTLSALYTSLNTDAERILRSAEQDYRSAITWMWLLAAGGILLSIAVAAAITRRITRTEQRLVDEKERAEITLHSIGDGVVTTDASGCIEAINTMAARLTAWTAEAARGRPLDSVLQLLDAEGAPCEVLRPVLGSGRTVRAREEQTLVTRGGREYAVELIASPVVEPRSRRVRGAVVVFRDVTEMRALAHQLAYQASHDGLTGLPNRQEFETQLQKVLNAVRRQPQDTRWVCYLDLDQFKVVNDTCGHMAGDELLKQVAEHLKRTLHEADRVARLGGDEFGVLLGHCEQAAAQATVERLRHGLEGLRFAWDNKSFPCTASMGLVPITASSGTLYDLLSAADTACYIAKDEGRNRVHVYRRDDDTQARHEGEMQWVHRINRALEEDRFVLYYQDIVALEGTDARLRCELLLRMRGENGEVIAPMAFIPAAERYNLMTAIDRWVVRKALQSFEQVCRISGPGRCAFTINLSGQSLCDDQFLAMILALLDDSPLEPARICFEITETAAIANLSRATAFIEALKARGCRFALDDFGSGLSSFGYLKSLPVDFLKIEGSFVRDIRHDPMDRALVESINQIGHVLGVETIAEYVTDAATLDILRHIGVDYVQGDALGRPAPLEELLRQVRQEALAPRAEPLR